MKEFSSWPTFPQLYANGEFVGGCDILKEMYASGALQKLLGVEEAPAAPVGLPRVTITDAAAKAFHDAGADAGADVLRLGIDSQRRTEFFISSSFNLMTGRGFRTEVAFVRK
jgi:monothiol glutaredoxin